MPARTTDAAPPDRDQLSALEAAYELARERVREAKLAAKTAKGAVKDAKRERKLARKALLTAHERHDAAEAVAEDTSARNSEVAAEPTHKVRKKDLKSRIPDSPEKRRAPRRRKARTALPAGKTSDKNQTTVAPAEAASQAVDTAEDVKV